MSKFGTNKANNSLKKKKPQFSPSQAQQNPGSQGYTPNESFNDRESKSAYVDQLGASSSSKGKKNVNGPQINESGKQYLNTTVEDPNEDEPVNGRGIFQNPVQDEEEPGHVPIADIMKHNKLEM